MRCRRTRRREAALDLTASNPYACGLSTTVNDSCGAAESGWALRYEPNPKVPGGRVGAEGDGYSSPRGTMVSAADMVLQPAQRGVPFVFRLLCNPGMNC